MSIRMWCPDAPVGIAKQPCTTCATGMCQPGWCNGGQEIVRMPELPELDFASAAAAPLFRLLSLDPWSGELTPNEIPNVLQRAIRVLNSSRMRSAATVGVKAEMNGGRISISPQTDADTIRRLRSIVQLLAEAKRRSLSVCWS